MTPGSDQDSAGTHRVMESQIADLAAHELYVRLPLQDAAPSRLILAFHPTPPPQAQVTCCHHNLRLLSRCRTAVGRFCFRGPLSPATDLSPSSGMMGL